MNSILKTNNQQGKYYTEYNLAQIQNYRNTDRALPEFDTHVLEKVLRMESEAHDPKQITEAQIQEDILGYRRFLLQHKMQPGIHIVPPVQIDRVWHIHIIQTKQYKEVCESYLGYFLNHASLICGAGGVKIKPWYTREEVTF